MCWSGASTTIGLLRFRAWASRLPSPFDLRIFVLTLWARRYLGSRPDELNVRLLDDYSDEAARLKQGMEVRTARAMGDAIAPV